MTKPALRRETTFSSADEVGRIRLRFDRLRRLLRCGTLRAGALQYKEYPEDKVHVRAMLARNRVSEKPVKLNA